MGLCVGLLIGLAGGCWSKAKEEAADPGETVKVQVINNEQDPGSLLVEGELVVEVRSSRGGASGELEPKLEQFVREALAITLQAALARSQRP